MKCKCGKPSNIYIRGQNQCWDCFDAAALRARSIHIDHTKPRVRLCDARPGDPINNMTISIAAAFLAHNPNGKMELCEGCLTVLFRDYEQAIIKAVSDAAHAPCGSVLGVQSNDPRSRP